MDYVICLPELNLNVFGTNVYTYYVSLLTGSSIKVYLYR